MLHFSSFVLWSLRSVWIGLVRFGWVYLYSSCSCFFLLDLFSFYHFYSFNYTIQPLCSNWSWILLIHVQSTLTLSRAVSLISDSTFFVRFFSKFSHSLSGWSEQKYESIQTKATFTLLYLMNCNQQKFPMFDLQHDTETEETREKRTTKWNIIDTYGTVCFKSELHVSALHTSQYKIDNMKGNHWKEFFFFFFFSFSILNVKILKNSQFLVKHKEFFFSHSIDVNSSVIHIRVKYRNKCFEVKFKR